MLHWYHRIRNFLTVQNGTAIVGLLIAFGWTWGTVLTLQKNFNYQRQVDQLTQEVELDKLRNQNLAYQQKYYQSSEYLELSAREQLGKASPGEKLVLLPDSSDIKDTVELDDQALYAIERPSNLQQWLRFFFGGQRAS